MKYLFLLFSFIFLISCTSKKEYQKPNWLLGKWIRTNNEENKTTYEFWDDNYTGLGFTLYDSDTTFAEKMTFLSNNDQLYLQVMGMGEQPTFFAFTQQSETSFTAENKQNQFPKKINYCIEKDTLKAVISNDDFSVDFKFVKLKE